MFSAPKLALAGAVLLACAAAVPISSAQNAGGAAKPPQPGALQRIDLAERLAAGKLRPMNRDTTKLQGSRDGVHVSEKEGPGLVWIEGSDLPKEQSR